MYVCISYACREYYKSLKTEYLKISFQVKVIQTLTLVFGEITYVL